MKRIKLGIIYGGMSDEHEISIASANSIIKNLNKEKYIISKIYIDKKGAWYENNTKIDNITNYLKKLDIVFPVLHGKYGEDGKIQGMLEMIRIPYVGCNVLSSALAMDKIHAKIIFDRANIKQAKWIYLKKDNKNYIYVDESFNEKQISLNKISNTIKDKLKYPVFIKPANQGSSIGISKVKNKKELKKALDYAFKYDTKILIEETIIGKEIECAVLEDKTLIASTPGQIISDEEFYSYNSKYKNNKSKLIVPANLSKETINKIKQTSIKAFKAISASTLARVDFFVNEDGIYINEINTMPGFTQISMYPKLWEYEGVTFTKLLDKIINSYVKKSN